MKHWLNSLPRLGLAIVVASSLTACGTFKASCAKPADYANAKELPPLIAPAGLEPPDTRAALKVPELVDPEQPRVNADDCLDHPPKFAQPKATPPQA